MPDDTFVCKDDYMAAGQNGGGKSQMQLVDTFMFDKCDVKSIDEKHKSICSVGSRLQVCVNEQNSCLNYDVKSSDFQTAIISD